MDPTAARGCYNLLVFVTADISYLLSRFPWSDQVKPIFSNSAFRFMDVEKIFNNQILNKKIAMLVFWF